MRIFGHSRSPGEHPFEYLHNGYISAAKGAGEVQTRSLSKGSSRTYIFVNASKMSAFSARQRSCLTSSFIKTAQFSSMSVSL